MYIFGQNNSQGASAHAYWLCAWHTCMDLADSLEPSLCAHTLCSCPVAFLVTNPLYWGYVPFLQKGCISKPFGSFTQGVCKWDISTLNKWAWLIPICTPDGRYDSPFKQESFLRICSIPHALRQTKSSFDDVPKELRQSLGCTSRLQHFKGLLNDHMFL